VFPDSNFLYDAGIPSICLHGLSGPFGLKWRFWEQNRGRGGAILTPQQTCSYFSGLLLLLCSFNVPCVGRLNDEIAGENRSRNASVRVRTDVQTDTRTDRDKLNL